MGRQAFLLFGLFLLAVALFPFWGAISVAAVFAFGLIKPVDRLSKRWGNRRRLVSGLVVAGLTILLLFPATFFSLRLYQLVGSAQKQDAESGVFSNQTLDRMSSAYERAESLAVKYGVGTRIFADRGDARESIRKGAGQAMTKFLALFTAAMASLPEIVVTMLVFGLFLFTFLAYPREIKKFSLRSRLFRGEDLLRTIQILKASSYNSLVANFFVGIMQASIITIGARAVGYHESVLIFSIVFAISYIPFIGAAPVGYLLALLSLATDGVSSALILAAVATFAGVIDNVVRPYLVASGGTEVNGVLSFAAILGAIGVFGLKGIFLGPVILTATVALLGGQKAERTRRKTNAEAASRTSAA